MRMSWSWHQRNTTTFVLCACSSEWIRISECLAERMSKIRISKSSSSVGSSTNNWPKQSFVHKWSPKLYRVTDLDVAFRETGNGGLIMLFFTTRWCCCKINCSAVLGCRFQSVKFDVLTEYSWISWGVVENFQKKCSLVLDLINKQESAITN